VENESNRLYTLVVSRSGCMKSYLHGNLCFHFIVVMFNVSSGYNDSIYFQILTSVKRNCIIVIHYLRSVSTHMVASSVTINIQSLPRPLAQWASDLTEILRRVLVSSE
jgi:hypothetical protein